MAKIILPFRMQGRNPAELMPRVTVDEQRGGYVFRNRWEDGNDFVASLFLDRNHLGGWPSDNIGCFQISGLGSDWAVQGAGQGAKDTNSLWSPGLELRPPAEP